jgi:hypothetical protein
LEAAVLRGKMEGGPAEAVGGVDVGTGAEEQVEAEVLVVAGGEVGGSEGIQPGLVEGEGDGVALEEVA